MYYVLRTVSLIVTRLDGLQEILQIFDNNHFKDIIGQCCSDNDVVREQALHLVSEIGVGEDHGLKQRVLKAGSVKAVIEVCAPFVICVILSIYFLDVSFVLFVLTAVLQRRGSL